MKKLTVISLIIFLVASFASAGVPLDFDGDGKTDIGVIRSDQFAYPATPIDWYVNRSSDNSLFLTRFGQGFSFGSTDPNNGDDWTPADFDGDGRTDIAVWRRSTREYFILNSSDGTLRVESFGQNGDDIRAVGDYDGDLRADLAVYRVDGSRPKNNFYIIKKSRNNPTGALTYVRIGSGSAAERYPGDFNGDGALDYCIRSGSMFSLALSSGGGTEYTTFGLSTDRAIAADVDGDRRTDYIVVREFGQRWAWYILERDGGGTGSHPIFWGQSTSTANPEYPFGGGDYDGDGREDIAVLGYTSPNLMWKVRRSSNPTAPPVAWGIATDRALVVDY